MRRRMSALLAGSAVAVCAAAAHAEDLDALKAQIEALSARAAALESVAAIPVDGQLITISDGTRVDTPGLTWSGRQNAAYGANASVMSALPVADAPSGATVTWSGYARAALIYNHTKQNIDRKKYDWSHNAQDWIPDPTYKGGSDTDAGDISIKARAQVRVTAVSGTAIGDVGMDIRLRGNFSGNGASDVYSDVAWGYWAMTPELSLGGGYVDSLGKIQFGLNGACVCYYTDNSDINFDPGDVSQMRLSYGSGPLEMAIAVEDASIRADGDDFGATDTRNGERLGAAGEITYTAGRFSGQIAAVWRGYENTDDIASIHSLWQAGVGLRVPLESLGTLSLAAAVGEGPVQNTYEGEIVTGSARNNTWWGVSGLASTSLSDTVHGEIAAGYMDRSLDPYTDRVGDHTRGGKWNQWTALAGLYYNPVNRLTLGIEGEWIETSFTDAAYSYDRFHAARSQPDHKYRVDTDTDRFTVDLVSIWRF